LPRAGLGGKRGGEGEGKGKKKTDGVPSYKIKKKKREEKKTSLVPPPIIHYGYFWGGKRKKRGGKKEPDLIFKGRRKRGKKRQRRSFRSFFSPLVAQGREKKKRRKGRIKKWPASSCLRHGSWPEERKKNGGKTRGERPPSRFRPPLRVAGGRKKRKREGKIVRGARKTVRWGGKKKKKGSNLAGTYPLGELIKREGKKKEKKKRKKAENNFPKVNLRGGEKGGGGKRG